MANATPVTNFDFDASQVNPSVEMSAVPPDVYSVMVSGAEIEQIKDKNDRRFKCSFRIIDGPLSNRNIPFQCWIEHSTPTAKQIGLERLSAICHAVQQLKISNVTQLQGKPFKVRTEIREVEQDQTPGQPPKPPKRYTDVVAFFYANGKPVEGGGVSNNPGNGAPAGGAPDWAKSAPAPAGMPAPTPQPAAAVVAAPVPVSQPAAPAEPEKTYFLNVNGTCVNPTAPFTLAQVMAFPGGTSGHVNEAGTQTWVPVSAFVNNGQPVGGSPAQAVIAPWAQ